MMNNLGVNINNIDTDVESCKIVTDGNKDVESCKIATEGDTDNVSTSVNQNQVNLIVEEPTISRINKKGDELLSLITIVSLLIFSLGIIGAIISFYVFGIKFLVEDKDESDECSSEIWDYVLTTIIVSFVFLTIAYKDKDTDSGKINPLLSVISSLTSIGLGIWGFILCQTEDCSAIKDSNLYTFAIVASYSQVISGGLTFLLFLIVVYLALNEI